jgi:hypothetical protein
LRFLQAVIRPLHGQSQPQHLYCNCEGHKALASKQENTMDRFMRNAWGLVIALGTSGLMFAVTLA